MKPHPDRLATTLAQREILEPSAFEGPFEPPGAGSDDARVDLKLLAYAAREALASRGTDEAEARLSDLRGPDLWAGTVQDGTARGFAVALEEAISLCAAAKPGADRDPTPEEEALGEVVEGKALRRKRDLLVASGGARMRFTRKGGLLFVDRKHDVHVENGICFEDRSDAGTLDGFEAAEGERARIFHPGFLQPVRHEQNAVRDSLILDGRLGRRSHGYPCRITITGRKDEPFVTMRVRIENRHSDHRLRIRFVGFPEHAAIRSRGTPGWESVRYEDRWFVAATLVRACGVLRVGDRRVAVPAAQCIGHIEHEFLLGGPPAKTAG